MDLSEAFKTLALIEAQKHDPNHAPKGYNECKECKKTIFDIDTFPDGLCSNCHCKQLRTTKQKLGDKE